MSSSKLRFVGGGRWAQIVLGELVKLNPKIDIDWVTSYSSNKQNLINKFSKFDKNIKIFEIKDLQKLSTPEKVIIISHSINHCRDFLIHNNSVPTLIEKPLFPNLKGFLNLSIIEKNHIFFNLEFYNAFFINDFVSQIDLQKIIALEIEWHDSFVESRANSETKYSEVFSSIFMDQLLHVLSIVKAMEIDTSKFMNVDVFFEQNNLNGEVIIQCEKNNLNLRISLSRFSAKRTRKVKVNNGQISLDFSSKPIVKKNGNFVQELHFKNRLFPIAKTLEGFLSHSKEDPIKMLSLNSLEHEINFCFKCESLYTKIYTSNNHLFINDFDPFLIYFAGIKFYSKHSNKVNINSNFYLKGHQGLEELKKWWKNSKSEFK